jgi:hypothetical protein
MGDNSAELQKAHEFYMAAAANRDSDSDTYEGARIRYFTLKNGQGWLQQEKTRSADTKLKPAIDTYRQQFQTLESQAAVQSGLVDSIAGIRDKQSALVNTTSSNFDFLDNFLQEKQAKMSAYDRFVELTTPAAYVHEQSTGQASISAPIAAYFSSFPGSFRIALDIIIAILVLFLILFAISKSRTMFAGWENYRQMLVSRTFGGPAPVTVINTPAPTTTTR